MKTIRLLMLMLLSAWALQTNAQGIEAGTVLMGGTLGFSTSSSTTTTTSESKADEVTPGSQYQFSIAPKMGYFFAKNFVAGMTFNFSAASRTTEVSPGVNVTESESQLLAGPFARYYLFPSNRVGIFAEAEMGLGASAVTTTANNTNTVSQISFGVGPGLTFFANDVVAIEALLKYNMMNNATSFTTNGVDYDSKTTIGKIDFGVGFQFYFNRTIGGGPGNPSAL